MHAYESFSLKIDSKSNRADTKLTTNPTATFDRDGQVISRNLLINAQQGSHLDISYSFTPVTMNLVSLKVPIAVEKCPVGFAFSYMSCSRCNGPRLYSIYRGATSCSDCPTNAICDGDSVKAKAGYYLVYKNATALENASYVPPQEVLQQSLFSFSSNLDLSQASYEVPFVIVTCPNTYCLEGNQCSDNRGGLLCGACRPGFSEWQGRCVECGSNNTNGGLVFLWLLYLAFIFVFQHLNAQSPRSGSLKILFFFTQSFLMISGPVSSQLLLWARAIF